MKNVVSHICGGLGNQMFQYACGRALSVQLGLPLLIDVTWYDDIPEGTTPREFLLPVFPNIHLQLVKKHESRFCMRWRSRWERLSRHILHLPKPFLPHTIFERSSMYTPLNNCKIPVALRGYWQSELYFKHCAETIRHDFAFPLFTEPTVCAIAKEILSCPNSVSLHVRRGDYISNTAAHSMFAHLGDDYYRSALEMVRHLAGDLRIFVFTDDAEWVRDNLFIAFGDQNASIVDSKCSQKPYADMYLMSLCRHHIIANSSFSWWGAWLSRHQSITIAPKQWFNQTEICHSICPETWIQL